MVKFFRQSEVATSELKKLLIGEWNVTESQTKRPIQAATRWNSCYAMIERVLLKLQRYKRSSKVKPPNFLSGDEPEALSEARDLLKLLDIVT
ncbi:hypothetical protein FOCC_FOCC015486, partial [Frankliniella occidentalis]